MARGTVKWFDESEGFGFIQRDDGPDVYVDGSAIVARYMSGGLHSLSTSSSEGQHVEVRSHAVACTHSRKGSTSSSKSRGVP